jgi:cysteinyl-tRNA synthetase
VIRERNESRENKNFQRADEIRGELKKGIVLEDKCGQTTWRKE